MGSEYGFFDEQLYKVQTNPDGTVSGRVPVPDAEVPQAASSLVADYLEGRLRKIESLAPGTAPETVPITRDDFGEGVLRPTFDWVMDRNATLAEKQAAIRTILGSSTEVITAFAAEFDESMATSIWGVEWTDKALDHQLPPEIPVRAPADTIVDAARTQGVGPPPNTSDGAARGRGRDGNGAGGERDAKTAGDPVILFSGQLLHEATDLEAPGRGLHFRFARTYLHQTRYRGPLGYGWDHTWNLWLREVQEVEPGGRIVNAVYRSTGRVRADRFVQVADPAVPAGDPLDVVDDAAFAAPTGSFDVLVKEAGEYRVHLATGVVVHYRADTLQADRIVDLNGNTMSLGYDAEHRLAEVVDPVGKRFGFVHDDLGRLVLLVDDTGRREVRFDYDDHGDLAAVDLVGEAGTRLETDYRYLGPDAGHELAHALTSVTGQSGAVLLDVEYGTGANEGDFGRVVRQRADTGELEYRYASVVDPTPTGIDPDADPVNAPVSATVVRGPRGHEVEHWFNAQGNVVHRVERLDVDGVPASVIWRYRYNQDGMLVREERPDGVVAQHEYGREAYAALGNDPDAAPPAERRRFGERRRTVLWPEPTSTENRTIVTEYDYDAWLRVVRERGPCWGDQLGTPLAAPDEVTFAYDGGGNLVRITYPDTTTASGARSPGVVQEIAYDAAGSVIEVKVGSVVTRYERYPDRLRSAFCAAVVRDPAGASVRTEYVVDDNGLVRATRLPSGAVDEHDYDDLHRPVVHRVIEPDGRVGIETSIYDKNGRLVEWHADHVDDTGAPLPRVVRRWRHDPFGRVVEDTVGTLRPRSSTYAWGPDGGLDRSTDAAGLQVRLSRDAAGRVIEAAFGTGAGQGRRRFRWRADGQLSAVVDAAGAVTRLLYDGFGRPAGMVDREGLATTVEADAAGRPVSQRASTVAGGLHAPGRWSQTDWRRDEVGRVTAVRDHLFTPPNDVTDAILERLVDYDTVGRPSTVTSPSGATHTTTYDRLGRPTSTVDADGVRTSWRYDDARATVTVTTLSTGPAPAHVKRRNRSVIELDGRGRVAAVVDGAGNRTTIARDTAGRVSLQTDPAGVATRRVVDEHGDVVSVNVGPSVTTTERDPRGEPLALVSPTGRRSTEQRNQLGHVVGTTFAGSTTQWVVDPEGRPTTMQTGRGLTTGRTFSPEGRVLAVHTPQAAVALTWSPTGQLLVADDGATQVSMRYDSLGRLVGEDVTSPFGRWSTKGRYDADGHLVELTYPDGRLVTWEQTPGGRVAAAHVAGREVVRFDRAGDWILGARAGALSAAVEHDPAGRPGQVTWKDAGGVTVATEQRVYTSTGACRIEQIADLRRVAGDDGLGRLSGWADHPASPPLALDAAFARDPSGSPRARQADLDAIAAPDPATAARTVSYQLDAEGARTLETDSAAPAPVAHTAAPDGRLAMVGAHAVTYDGDGNVVSVGPRQFGYDDHGRLVTIDATTCHWDPLGRLLAVEGGGRLDVARHFGPQLIEVADPAGQAAERLCWVGARLWEREVSGQPVTVLSSLAGDVIGSADAAGNVTLAPRSDPFGDASHTSLVTAGYRGGPGVAGLWLMGARAYDPRTGRFLQPDPLGTMGDLHPYLYARHSPLQFADPSGLSSTDIDWGLAARSAVAPLLGGIAAGLAIAFAVGAGIISAPFVLVAGGVLLLGGLALGYLSRANEALDAGMTDYQGAAALAAVGDLVGGVDLYEGVTGRAALGGRTLTGEERSERVGRGLGNAVGNLVGGRVTKLGTSAGLRVKAARTLTPHRASIAAPKEIEPPLASAKSEPPPTVGDADNDWSSVLAPDANPVTLRSAAAAAEEAAAAGLVDEAAGRLGLLKHNRAASVRAALGLTGADAESAHVLFQAAGKALKAQGHSYSPGKALTTLLPPATHDQLDQAWVRAWNAAVADNRTLTAGDVHNMVRSAIDQLPNDLMSPAAKNTLAWRLEVEMFSEMGLSWTTVVR